MVTGSPPLQLATAYQLCGRPSCRRIIQPGQRIRDVAPLGLCHTACSWPDRTLNRSQPRDQAATCGPAQP